MINKIIYKTNRRTILTFGLRVINDFEIQIEVKSKSLIENTKSLLDYIVNYLISSGRKLKAGETMSYGCWLLKFVLASDGVLEVWELETSNGDFVRGASSAVRIWQEQNLVCQKYGVLFTPPSINTLAAISDGVYDGDQVEGVRYEQDDKMSGWYITTDKYDGDIKTLKIEHVYHLIILRPDLAKYLALPSGFRFDTCDDKAWLDKSITDELLDKHNK